MPPTNRWVGPAALSLVAIELVTALLDDLVEQRCHVIE